MAQPAPKNHAETPTNELRTPAHGRGKLRNGGTNKGGPGRPPKTFATFMRSLRDDQGVQDAIKAAAQDANSRGFAPVLKTMTDYDEDKPKEEKKLSGELVIRVVRDA